jgi:hypothetical protein
VHGRKTAQTWRLLSSSWFAYATLSCAYDACACSFSFVFS